MAAAGQFTQNLVGRWAIGTLSAKDVQDIAMDTMLDGAKGVDAFAAMGASGKHAQNMFRTMQTILGYHAGAPEMDWFEVSTIAGPRTHPFFLPPHKILSSYHAAVDRAEFRKSISGPCWRRQTILGIDEGFAICTTSSANA